MGTDLRTRLDLGRLAGSKWSASSPVDRDKHFTVVRLRKDETNARRVVGVELKAVLSRRSREVDLDALRDPEQWQPGWR